MSDVVCVLGMHRSGTSAVSRVLNLLGFHLGPDEELVPGQASNPRGFWEHRGLVAVNEEILDRLGGRWHEPPEFPDGWETSPRLGDVEERARALIARDFGTAPAWSWKDPRACLTLPFWQRLLPGMRYVVSLRSPVDVARSLYVRDGFPFEKGVSLWFAHVEAALRHSSAHARILLFFEDLMADPRAEGERLARFLGREHRWANDEIRRRIEESLEGELHHHRSAALDVVSEAELAFPVKALYLVLRLAVAAPPDLQAVLDRFADDARRAQREPALLLARIAALQRALETREAEVPRLAAAAARDRTFLEAVTGELERLRAVAADQQAQLARMASTTGWQALDRYRRLTRGSAVASALHAAILRPLTRFIVGHRPRH